MVDKELLNALSDIMDAKLGPLVARMDKVEESISDFATEQAEMKKVLTRVALTQENEVLPKIKMIYENQMEVVAEQKAIEGLEDKTEALATDVWALKVVTSEHTESIKELRAAK